MVLFSARFSDYLLCVDLFHLEYLSFHSRREQRLALFRRVLLLVLMIISPGVIDLFLVLRWCLFGSLPSSMDEISSLGQTEALLKLTVEQIN